VPLTGFAPDLDPTTPGVVVDCDNIVPTVQGLSAGASLAPTGLPALASTPIGAYATTLLDGTKRFFASTATAIYEAATTAWTDRSRGGGYTGTQRHRFCVFGNAVLASNRSEPIQQALPGANFADIATAPKAAVLVSVNGFVMALDTTDATYGDRPDGWWCSGLRDQTVWTPSLATQAANGRLVDTPGRITAGAVLGNACVAYKATSMYVGRYVGPPLIWTWERVPGDIGCAGAESVVALDTQHFFVGPSDFYVFDGNLPQPIGQDVREWFFKNLNLPYRQNIVGVSDVARSLVYWYFPSINSSDGSLDSMLVYNTQTGKWGKRSLSVQVPVVYVSGAITYDALGSYYATYDSLPTTSYDSPFWLADQTVPGVFQAKTLYSLTGTPSAAWLQTGDFGDLTQWSFLSRVSPRYRITPSTGTATNYYRATTGETLTTDTTAALTRSRFDFRRSARYHAVRMDHSGAWAVDGLDVDLKRTTPE
jgi:hypothetical protein